MRVCWVLMFALAGLSAAGSLAADQQGFLVAIASIAGAALSAAIGFLLYEALQAYRRHRARLTR
jgi:hypothetical protein